MAKGIGAVVVMATLILALSVLTSVGYVAGLDSDLAVDVSSQNADVQQAAEQLTSVEFGEGRSSAILQGPLAAVTPVVRIFQTLQAVLLNTSGVLQLLYGAPKPAADAVQLIGQIAFVVTGIYLIRSGSPI